MIKCKKHLEDINRSKISCINRNELMCLNMNENVGVLSKDFLKKCFDKIKLEDINLYPQYYEFIKKLAKYNEVKEENILIGNGSDSCIKYIFEAYMNEGDVVATVNPTFAMYEIYSDLYKCDLKKVMYDEKMNFPREKFSDIIKNQHVKLAVIVNPNNPTGTILTKQELRYFCELCKENNTLIIIDEAYYYFYEDTIVQLINEFENLIVLRTFSKLCGLAGIRVGYMIANKTIISNTYKVKPSFDISSISVIIANELIENCGEIDKLIDNFKKAKVYIIKKLKEKDIEFIEGKANFVLIKCNSPKIICEELEKKGILVYTNFNYKCIKDYIRVSISSMEIMKRFWIEFEKVYR